MAVRKLKLITTDSADFNCSPESRNFNEDRVLAEATRILDGRIRERDFMSNPRDTCEYLRLKLHGRKSEVFCVLWLDNRHRVIAYDEIFQGTIDGCAVHAREVVRTALAHNACAAVFAHPHPSGVAEPSAADRAITHTLRDALALVGVRVLDHIVCGEGEPVSMAARGLL